jgi:deoxycytidylate deaminase
MVEEYIAQNRNAGPCAKRVVYCILTSPESPISGSAMGGRSSTSDIALLRTSHHVFIGENWCMNPQEECPREKGEGYEKCKTICKQQNHAEEDALAQAKHKGVDVTDWCSHLFGHEYYCRSCQEALFDAGIQQLRRGSYT